MKTRHFSTVAVLALAMLLGGAKGCFEDPPHGDPVVCPAVYAPVCGTDGNTYGNECELDLAHAVAAHPGECERPCTSSDQCDPGQYCDLPEYFLEGDASGGASRTDSSAGASNGGPAPSGHGCLGPPPGPPVPSGVCRPTPVCDCAPLRDPAPVCGVDGVTYDSACIAGCNGVDVASYGPCAHDCLTDADCSPTEECLTLEYAAAGVGGGGAMLRGTCSPRNCSSDSECGGGATCVMHPCPPGADCLVAQGTCEPSGVPGGGAL